MTGKDIADHLLAPINPYFCSLVGYFSVIKGLLLFNPFVHNPNHIFSYLFFGYSPLSFVIGIMYIAVGASLIVIMKRNPSIKTLVLPLRAAASLWLVSSLIEFYLNPGLSTWAAPLFIAIYCIFVASNFYVNSKEAKELT